MRRGDRLPGRDPVRLQRHQGARRGVVAVLRPGRRTPDPGSAASGSRPAPYRRPPLPTSPARPTCCRSAPSPGIRHSRPRAPSGRWCLDPGPRPTAGARRLVSLRSETGWQSGGGRRGRRGSHCRSAAGGQPQPDQDGNDQTTDHEGERAFMALIVSYPAAPQSGRWPDRARFVAEAAIRRSRHGTGSCLGGGVRASLR